jgi:hypothetical protein
MTPADVIAGKDPQLERAIAIVMEDLKKNPPVQAKRPPYPVKTGVGIAQKPTETPQPPGGSK